MLAKNDNSNNFAKLFNKSTDSLSKSSNLAGPPELPKFDNLEINSTTIDKFLYSENIIKVFQDSSYIMEVYSIEDLPDISARYPNLANQPTKQKLFYYDKTKEYLFYLNTDTLNLTNLKNFCEVKRGGEVYWEFENLGQFYISKPYLQEVRLTASSICE